MMKESLLTDQTKVIIPLVAILHLNLFNTTLERAIKTCQSSFLINNTDLISLLFLICVFLVIFVYTCLPLLQNLRNFYTKRLFHFHSKYSSTEIIFWIMSFSTFYLPRRNFSIFMNFYSRTDV